MEIREKDRKHYKRPQVSQIRLEIEEVVLSFCKASADAAGKQSICNTPACKETGNYGS